MSIPGRSPAECPVCGAPVHPKDRFCAACGADVVANGAGSTSLLDDLMPADPPVERRAWDTNELPVQHADEPAHPYGAYDEPTHPDVPPAVRDDEPRRGSIVLPIAVLVGVVLVAVLGWRVVFGGGGDDPQVASDTTTSTSQAAPASPDSSGEASPSEAPSASPSTDGPERITLASTAEQCGDVAGATVYRGNEVTTCEFALEVAKALGTADVPTRVSARSPVTNRDYAMDCEDTAPVTCRGGNDALVYVDRG